MRIRTITATIATLAITYASACTAPAAVQRAPLDKAPASSGCGSSVGAASELRDANGRRARLSVPAGYRSDRSYPLVVSLHPFTLPPETWEAYSRLAEKGVARGFVVVTPLGSDPGPRWSVPGGLPGGPDDIGYIDGLINDVASRVCIDRTRVFAAGFSAGAAMAKALGCELPDRFRAVMAEAGANLTGLCPDSDPVSTLVVHGTADPIAPPTGSYIIFAPPIGLHIDDVITELRTRAGCAPEPVRSAPTATVEVSSFVGCTSGKRVEYRSMVGAGHTWAGTGTLYDFIVGPTDMSFDSTELALDFFDAAP